MTTEAHEMTSLADQLTATRLTIHTDGYPMSIGELTNMFKEGELIIRPAFQRLFRWEDEQKSLLVESILLGIPLPSIFVSQDDSGRWELIDGLQRISTILQLQGLLSDEFEPLILQSTKYLPALSGKCWDISKIDAQRINKYHVEELSEAQRLDIKRSKIDVKIVKRESSTSTKYDLFQRLNSYGSPLSAQEIRNANLVGTNSDFVEWLQKLASRDSFVESTALPDKDLAAKYNEELVLRFLWLHAKEDVSLRGLRQFQEQLESSALELASVFPEGSDHLEAVFNTTFDTIHASAGDKAFRKWDKEKGRFSGGFLNTAFEVIAMGLGYHVASGSTYRSDIPSASQELWGQEDMTTRFATGKATDQRLSLMLPKGRALMAGPRAQHGTAEGS